MKTLCQKEDLSLAEPSGSFWRSSEILDNINMERDMDDEAQLVRLQRGTTILR